jgi:hypothetical protein
MVIVVILVGARERGGSEDGARYFEIVPSTYVKYILRVMFL